MLTPMLSDADPQESAEGSIDPLGIYPMADILASRLVPGVRERQRHPRFLTIVAASLSLCSDFEDETVASDGVSEPWQVFEWYVIEGLTRATSDSKLLRGLPGRDKADKARADDVPLSERRYLKNARTFGFHGIYRALAREIGIETSDRLGEAGFAILKAWEKEQGLQGFSGIGDGPGRSERQRVIDGISDGLNAGATARKTWGKFFAEHFGIYQAGELESERIRLALIASEDHTATNGFRGEIFQTLTSSKGQLFWMEQRESEDPSERKFHEWMMESASSSLVVLLTAIGAYERFCRYLQTALDECLAYMAHHTQRIKLQELADLRGVKTAAKILPTIFPETIDALSAEGLDSRFSITFDRFSETMDPMSWIEGLLEFHVKVQRGKPPAGKMPWFDRFDDGTYLIRPGYVREYQPRHDDAYVHAYRTHSLWSFAHDLKLINQ
ncbi:MAG: hypothetical protein K9M08_17960 [Pirellula sp.]|nr:hypothetical protein [Pirellula sp.]